LGDLGSAEADLKAAREILEPLQASFDLARISFYLAGLYQQQGLPSADAAWLDAIKRIISGGYTFLLESERSLAFPLLIHYLDSPDPALSAHTNQLLDQLASVPPPPLTINTLGRFEVRQGRQVIPEQTWRQRKAGDLFRLLLIHPRRRAWRDQVIQDLWPDKPASSVQTYFHQATSSLRKALEPDLPEKFPSRYLSVERGEIILHLPEGSSVDFELFERHMASHDWEAALQVYQGDLFPGDMYSDWAINQREHLKQEAVRAALGAARQAMQAGKALITLQACQRALILEPWQEEAVLLGMQACMALNDRSGALRLYRKLERNLREELDVAPQEAVQAYYRSLISP
jgi:DNA-binding SARP family transcriptional activator